MKRRGFTLLEILVVIGILAVLSSLLVMAIGHMQTNAKRQQTTLMLETLRAMYADFDSTHHYPFGAGHIQISGLNQTDLATVMGAISMPCPGNVSTSGADRNGSAVQLTRDFMAQLQTTTGNLAALGKLGANSIMTFAGPNLTANNWVYTGQYSIYGTASDANNNVYFRTLLYTGVDPATQKLEILQDGQVNASTPPSSSYTVNSISNPYYWMPVLPVPNANQPLTTPVILDAWGNPIIFVLGGVLGNNANPVNAGGTTTQVNSSEYRPFFASAGPDGDFSKGDDNMYSFEK